MKSEYLACYDYGTGGAWAYLLADSAAQIRERFPELQVVTDRPNWLSDEQDRLLHERMTIDINDTDNAFLAALLRQRT
jgi:hypothetical protein